MLTMEWEKQDNELRKLMDNDDFLPDGEKWDAAYAWHKFRKAKEGAAKQKKRWQPLAAAACAAALVGLFFWWLMPYSGSNNISTAKKVAVPKAVLPVQQAITIAPVLNNTESEKNTITVAVAKTNASAAPRSLTNNQQWEVVEKVDDSAALVIANSLIAVTAAQPELINPAFTTSVPEGPLPNTNQAQVTVMKKPAIRVIHYNSLNSSSPVVPPVFVQLTRSASQWNMQEMLPAENAKHPAVMLKIDLSPVPKKSL